MSLRKLIPRALVSLLFILVTASAAVGVALSSSPAPPNRSAGRQLQEAVRHTLSLSSFTVHSAGQALVYQAPDRTKVVVVADPQGGGITYVTIGSASYLESLPQLWIKVPTADALAGVPPEPGLSLAKGYLQALSAFPVASVSGDVYSVYGVLSKLPEALVRLIFTTAEKTKGGSEFTFGLDNPKGNAAITGHITVINGLVVSETFTEVGAYGTTGNSTESGTVTYSALGSSPRIDGPTKAVLYRGCIPQQSGPPVGNCQQLPGLTVVSPTTSG